MEEEINYNAQLVAVEAKLAKDPTNQELLDLKNNLIEALELLEDFAPQKTTPGQDEYGGGGEDYSSSQSQTNNRQTTTSDISCKDGAKDDKNVAAANLGADSANSQSNNNQLSELERKKKEKNRKKRAKLKEKDKELSEIAASEAQSWQSFACKKGLKGVTKRSIFASPCSAKGKVGVGTNGIADAPSAQSGASSTLTSRRK